MTEQRNWYFYKWHEKTIATSENTAFVVHLCDFTLKKKSCIHEFLKLLFFMNNPTNIIEAK